VVRSLFEDRVAQTTFLDQLPSLDVPGLHETWDRAVEREQASRSRFAQHAIKPEEVAQELYASDTILGSPATVAALVRSACQRLGVGVKPQGVQRAAVWFEDIVVDQLPVVVRERLNLVPQSRRNGEIGRTHPLTEALAEHLLDLALDGAAPLVVSRCGAMRSSDVQRRTTLLLLRLRLLIETAGQSAPLLAEELIVVGFSGRPDNLTWLDEASALSLIDTAQPAGNLSAEQRSDTLHQTLEWLPLLAGELNAIAQARAVALHESHRRVRQATRAGRVQVRPNLPLDLLGVYVLLPVPKGILS
jgi:hypothetical protein